MSDQICILVVGLGPLASATARLLFLAGYAAAVYRKGAPKVLRRNMSFIDAWRNGKATLNGVEARLVRSDAEFLAGWRQKSFIPLLAPPFADVVERWPWDVIVEAREEGDAGGQILFDTPLRIGLGAGFVASENCDLAIDVDGLDPGAVIREGAVRTKVAGPQDRSFRERGRLAAPASGIFKSEREIGALVAQGDPLGTIAGKPLAAPCAGRLIGLLESGVGVAEREAVVEIGVRGGDPWNGVGRADQALARAILLAVQMELNGWAPVTFNGRV
jgi:xanthine dehydrogenase accessory factor